MLTRAGTSLFDVKMEGGGGGLYDLWADGWVVGGMRGWVDGFSRMVWRLYFLVRFERERRKVVARAFAGTC